MYVKIYNIAFIKYKKIKPLVAQAAKEKEKGKGSVLVSEHPL